MLSNSSPNIQLYALICLLLLTGGFIGNNLFGLDLSFLSSLFMISTDYDLLDEFSDDVN